MTLPQPSAFRALVNGFVNGIPLISWEFVHKLLKENWRVFGARGSGRGARNCRTATRRRGFVKAGRYQGEMWATMRSNVARFT
jgi:hypothetical protein